LTKRAATDEARHFWPGLAAALWLVAVGLRIPGLDDDLWLDEIWSLEWIGGTSHWWELLTARHHEINHWLMSLVLRITGAEPAWHARLVPLLLSGAGLGVVAFVARRRGTEMLWLALLATSTMLIHYSTEARGYAGAMTMGIIATVCARSYLADASAQARWPLVAALTLGIGFHPSFAFVSAGIGAWILIDHGTSLPAREALRRLAAVLLLPAIAAGAAWLSIRQMEVGGAMEHRASEAMTDLASYTLGLAAGWPLVLGGGLALGLCLFEAVAMVRSRDAELALYLVGIIGAPVLLTAARGEPYVFARHFLIVVPLLLLWLSRALVRLAGLGAAARVAAVGLTLALLGANLLQWQDWTRKNRGAPREALAYVVSHSPSTGPIGIASDQDFRNSRVVEFHSPHVGGSNRIEYVYDENWSNLFPDWLIVSRYEMDSRPRPRTIQARGASYRLEREFPAAPVSGCLWALYHRTG
jgi:hypothetical protein